MVNLSSGGGGGGGGGGEDFTVAALDTAGAEQRAAYEAAVVAHEEEEVRTVRSTVPRGMYIHRKVGEMEEMELVGAHIGVEVWMDGRMEWCSADVVEAKQRRQGDCGSVDGWEN